jgi:hypothetical protein
MKIFLLVLVVLNMPSQLIAETLSWQCQNTINEINCINHLCSPQSINDSRFTLTIQNNSKIKICTRNKCWNGEITDRRSTDQQLLDISGISWTMNNQYLKDYKLGINYYAKSLYLKSDNRIHPLQCVMV